MTSSEMSAHSAIWRHAAFKVMSRTVSGAGLGLACKYPPLWSVACRECGLVGQRRSDTVLYAAGASVLTSLQVVGSIG
jgi:hypothetical protein